METINKKIALIVAIVGVGLLLLSLTTALKYQLWFLAVLALWLFVFCSSCYRLTPLFKARNKVEQFIQRDAQHLLLFSLTGFFDKKLGPQWVVINNIERIETANNELVIHSNNNRRLCISLPSSKAQLEQFLQRLLTEREKQSIAFQ